MENINHDYIPDWWINTNTSTNFIFINYKI